MNKNKPFNFVLIGRSGSGKGTQAELLREEFSGLYTLSTGSLFRDLAKQDTDAGLRIKKILNEGGLPLDDLATTLWMYDLAYNLREDQGLLADGFPRRLNEAKSLDRFLEFVERIDRTFYILLDISEEEATNRLLARGREDDNPSAIRGRLDYFQKRVIPVLEYYEDRGVLIRIDGEKTPSEVHMDVMSAIKNTTQA